MKPLSWHYLLQSSLNVEGCISLWCPNCLRCQTHLSNLRRNKAMKPKFPKLTNLYVFAEMFHKDFSHHKNNCRYISFFLLFPFSVSSIQTFIFRGDIYIQLYISHLATLQTTLVLLVQEQLRAEVLCTLNSTRLGFELMTSRSWQYISCHCDACSNHSAINDFKT